MPFRYPLRDRVHVRKTARSERRFVGGVRSGHRAVRDRETLERHATRACVHDEREPEPPAGPVDRPEFHPAVLEFLRERTDGALDVGKSDPPAEADEDAGDRDEYPPVERVDAGGDDGAAEPDGDAGEDARGDRPSEFIWELLPLLQYKTVWHRIQMWPAGCGGCLVPGAEPGLLRGRASASASGPSCSTVQLNGVFVYWGHLAFGRHERKTVRFERRGARKMDDTTARDDRGTDPDQSRGPSRRALLATVGGVGVASALAGCNFDPTSQEFEATPVVLTGEGPEVLGLPEFELSESTRTESVGGVGEVTAISYLSVHSLPGEGDPPVRFDEPAPGFRRIGVLSTPSPEVVGGMVNPFASEPLDDLVAGEEGRDLLVRTGVLGTSDFEWRDPPRRVDTRDVEFLGETTQARSYMGVALGGSGGPMTVLFTLARIPHGGDVVLAGEFIRRTTPVDPVEVGSACVDDLCQLPAPEQVDMWRRYQRAGAYLASCREIIAGGRVTEVCGTSGSVPDRPTVTITDARLVQQVEGTVVKPPDGSVSHTESDPDLVVGENTAVVFEFDTLDDLDELDGPLEVEVTHGDRNGSNRTTESFEVSRADLEEVQDGTHTMAVLHASDNPVFELTDDASIEIEAKDIGVGLWERVTPHPVVDLDPLTVGFIAIQDEDGGDRYGTNRGRPRAYRRSYESAAEYIRRAYPGDVVTYGHRSHLILGKSEVTERTNLFGVTTRAPCDDNCVVYRDMKRVQRELNRIATDSSYPKQGTGFPGGGILHTDGLDRSSMVNEIRNGGFDVVVAIVPGNDSSNAGATDYYNHHNMSVSGLAFGDPDAAVSSRGASASGGDQRICVTVAQEIGHYFQDDYRGPSGDPMAQRRNDNDDDDQPTVSGTPIDPVHARNQNSNRVSGGDAPGVVSTAYDLEDGFANLQSYRNPDGSFSLTGPDGDATEVGKSPSYMSYTGDVHRAWTDARIHKQLIDSGWTVSGTSGSNSPAFVVSGDGFVAEDGSVYYDDVVAYRGVERYADVDDEGAATVELLGPGGEVLERTRVPVEIGVSHHGGFVGGAIEAPSFTLPFAETGVRVRTTLEGVRTPMNPVERSVRDAVRRVPEAGFHGEAADARDSIGRALDDVAAAMGEGEYGEAAATMDGPVRRRIVDHVREYEVRLDEPTLEGLVELVDEMVRRLRLVAEVEG